MTTTSSLVLSKTYRAGLVSPGHRAYKWAMAEPTNAQILSAISSAVAALYAAEPEGPLVDPVQLGAAEPVPLQCPPTLGSSRSSQVLNPWLMQACHNAKGVEVDEDMLATCTRVAAFVREPKHLRKVVQDVVNVDLIPAAILSLPEEDEGNLDVTRGALEVAILQAASNFYPDYSVACRASSMDAMHAALTTLYDGDTPRHTMIEVFAYWDMIPDETLFLFVSQYFLCEQAESDYWDTLIKQKADGKAKAEAAAAVALKDSTDKQRANTASGVSVVPATSDT